VDDRPLRAHQRVSTTPPPPLVTGTFPLRLTVAASTAVDIATYSVRIAAAGAAGAREATAPRALKLRLARWSVQPQNATSASERLAALAGRGASAVRPRRSEMSSRGYQR